MQEKLLEKNKKARSTSPLSGNVIKIRGYSPLDILIDCSRAKTVKLRTDKIEKVSNWKYFPCLTLFSTNNYLFKDIKSIFIYFQRYYILHKVFGIMKEDDNVRGKILFSFLIRNGKIKNIDLDKKREKVNLGSSSERSDKWQST